MKLSCLQENLAKGLAIVDRAVPTKSTLPVTMNVLLATDQARLKLAATNLEIAITTWAGAKVEEEGAITVPARLLKDFVTSLGPDKIDMALNVRTRTLDLKGSRWETSIKGIEAEEFPPIPRVSDHYTTSVEAKAFQEAIHQVAFAAATDESRPVLAGVLLSFEEEILTMAAADGFRLGVRRLALGAALGTQGASLEPVGAAREAPVHIIAPARAMQELARILGSATPPEADRGEESEVQIAIAPNRSQVLFHMANVDLVSRLIEGTFPNYQQIIPKSYTTRVLVSTGDFLRATKIAFIFARDAANMVKLGLIPGEELRPGRLVVSAAAAEVGSNTMEIDAIVEGEAVQIAFNAKYLTDVLGVLPGGGQVALEVSNPSSPGVLRPTGAEDYIHVIMPMHITR